MCRVHRAHVQLLRGEWDDAERGALEVVALLDANRVDYAAEAWYVVAEVRRLRGDLSAADAYDEAHPADATRNRGGRCCGSSRATRRARDDGAIGRRGGGRRPAAAGTDLRGGGGDRARRGAAGGRGGCRVRARGDGGAVRHFGAGGDGGHSARGGAAGRGPGRRRLPGAARRPPALARTGRRVRRRPYQSPARRGLPGARRRGVGRGEVAKAQATFDRLGAHRPAPEPPDGLTRRECEVLALVAEGRSNLQIGEALYISDRTVARHLTNIFHKIVTSRTQAARYALDRGLSTSR